MWFDAENNGGAGLRNIYLRTEMDLLVRDGSGRPLHRSSRQLSCNVLQITSWYMGLRQHRSKQVTYVATGRTDINHREILLKVAVSLQSASSGVRASAHAAERHHQQHRALSRILLTLKSIAYVYPIPGRELKYPSVAGGYHTKFRADNNSLYIYI